MVAADLRVVFFALLRGALFARLLADLREPLFRLAMNRQGVCAPHRAAAQRRAWHRSAKGREVWKCSTGAASETTRARLTFAPLRRPSHGRGRHATFS